MTNMYDGSQKCCGAPGTPPAADPCSILNSPGFLAAQAADVGPINPATGVPISAGSGAGAAELAQVAGYDNNTQHNAIQCWNNPGATFVDPMGNQITCPSPSLNDNGILISAYSPGQLAAMLQGVSTPKVPLAGDLPFALQFNPGPAPMKTPAVVVQKPPVVPMVNTPSGGYVAAPSSRGVPDVSPASPVSPVSSVTSLLGGIPTWGLIAAGIGALWLLGGKH